MGAKSYLAEVCSAIIRAIIVNFVDKDAGALDTNYTGAQLMITSVHKGHSDSLWVSVSKRFPVDCPTRTALVHLQKATEISSEPNCMLKLRETIIASCICVFTTRHGCCMIFARRGSRLKVLES